MFSRRNRKKFIAFGLVGVVGFVVNTGSVYGLRGFVGLYAAGILAWVIAATATWWLNRIWTFKVRDESGRFVQWLKFLAANAAGFALYFLVFSSLVTLSPFCARNPVVAIVAGAAVSLVLNYALSHKLVFRSAAHVD